MRIVKLSKESKENLLADLLKRDPNNYGQYADTVQAIVDDVKARGDEALFEYTEKFDKVKVTKDTIRVTKEEIDEALKQVDPKLMEVMVKSMKNIRAFHEKQKQLSWFDTTPDGTILGQRVTPLDSVGLYVPGGKAAYPSSVLMNIIPAEVAGVNRIVMVTPPGKDGKVNPVTLAAAHIAGATEVYKVGGAQAIAALAFGTESIPKVNKIEVLEIFMLRLQRRLYMVMSASTALPDLVRSWFLQMRVQMQSSLQQIFCHRQSMTSLPALFLLQPA